MRSTDAQDDLPRATAANPSSSIAPGRTVTVPFYAMAFFSGLAALIYEVTWARMLALTFGSTTLSAAAVIAGFMGGMGLGAWLYHLAGARVSRPLVLYAGLELGIAVTTAALTRTFYHLPNLLSRVSDVVPPGPGLALARFVVVFVLLLIPAMLMGATFPALCTVMIRNVRGVDRHLGMIYGINTIGAAAGALCAGLVLIEWLGLTHSATVANVVNLAVGGCALTLLGSSLGRMAKRPEPVVETAIPTFLPRWLIGVVLFVSGFATLSYEILWFRALRFVVGNSTYALTTVLVVFLVGLGLGSLWLERAARRRSPERDLGLCHCAIAALAMFAAAGSWVVVSVPGVHDQVSIFSDAVRASAWWKRLLDDASLAALTMLPAAVFMGLSFPLASRLFLGDVRKLGRRIGGAYLLANLGSILGALLAAVVLLPYLGTIGGTKLIAASNLVLALALLVWTGKRARGWRLPAMGVTIWVGAAIVLLPPSLSRIGEASLQTSGVVVYTRDGDLATVQVLEDPKDSAMKTMTVDGCRIGWSEGYRERKTYRKQVLLAHIPMIVDHRIRRTLNVGLGSAATLRALATYPHVETLDCVEISAAVVEASGLFPESAVLDDPRVTLTVDDAVHFLLRGGADYDLIISDGKQSPFFSGNATLLCREFYRHADRRLTDDGIFIQWLPLGTLHSDFCVNLRTCCEVFPLVEVMYVPPDSVFVLAGRRSLFDRPRLPVREFEALPVSSDLDIYLLDHPSALLGCWTSGKPQLQRILGDGPVSTWDRLLLDFTAYKATGEQWSRSKTENLALLLEAEGVRRAPGDAFELAYPLYRESAALLRRAFKQTLSGDAAGARALIERAVAANPSDRVARGIQDGLYTGPVASPATSP